MSPTFLSLLLRPFFNVLLFLGAAVLARVILRFIPEGRLKRLLTWSWRRR